MSLPPMPPESCDEQELRLEVIALCARIKALNQYARHQYPSCMADEEGVRCDCGLSELLDRLNTVSDEQNTA